MTRKTGNTDSFPKVNWIWIAVNVLSWFLGELAYDQLDRIFSYSSLGFLPIILVPLIIALGQWLYLRRFFEKIIWWIPATWFALSVNMFIAEMQTIAGEYGMAPFILVSILAGWVFTGVLQWLVLRAHMPRAGWWILGSAAGSFFSQVISNIVSVIGLGILFSLSSSEVVTLDSSTTVLNLIMLVFYLLTAVLGYGIYGLITGYVLYKLSRNSSKAGQEESIPNK